MKRKIRLESHLGDINSNSIENLLPVLFKTALHILKMDAFW